MMLFCGYFYGYIILDNIPLYFVFNNLKILQIFQRNLLSTLINYLLCYFSGGILSVVSISISLFNIGLAIREVQLRLRAPLIKVLTATFIHGIGEFLVMGIIIYTSIILIKNWYKKLFYDSNEKIFNSQVVFYQILLSVLILLISAFIEVKISHKIFENLYIAASKTN